LPQRRAPIRSHDQRPDPARPDPARPDGARPDGVLADGVLADGAGDPDAAGRPRWLMQPAGIVAAGTAVAAAVIIGSVPALVMGGPAHGPVRHPAVSRSTPAPTAPRATAAMRRPSSSPSPPTPAPAPDS
jgi:hypothetical protein